MSPLELVNHLLNFVAPAVWMALLVPLGARFIVKKVPSAPPFWVQAGVSFALNVTVLALGLWFFGRDGKMATYSAMVFVCATWTWMFSRSWKN
jgi:hypothetical protein